MPFRFWLRLATALLIAGGIALPAVGGVVMCKQIEPGVIASLKGGRVLFLECRPPQGNAARHLLGKYLANPKDWEQYKGRMAVAIPYAKLNPKAQRRVLESLFQKDYVNESGWWHTVLVDGVSGVESWWVLGEWFTGKGTQYRQIQAEKENRDCGEILRAGQRILIPRALLREGLKAVTPGHENKYGDEQRPKEAEEQSPEGEGESALLPDLTILAQELRYGKDKEGSYAAYRLKKGEALYSAVVVRYTDYQENVEVQKACDVIQKRSSIRDVRKMCAGQEVRIPLHMLSDRYQPHGSEQRETFEKVKQEAKRLQVSRVQSKDLKGVVVILDPGHGGRDQGAAVRHLGLYEDELNYDIVCRVKRLLEKDTQARTYITMQDRSQGYKPSDLRRFPHDQDEEVKTSPVYNNYDAKISANLRWYLANHYYRQELAQGVDPRKMIFLSVHCDAIFNAKVRGAMFYVPGAKYRRDSECPAGSSYNRFAEARGKRTFTTNAADRRRDEALSRNFANTLAVCLRTHKPGIKVHSTGDPIRNVIRRSGGRAYVPAVLRNNAVPTKVLLEVANMCNTTDQQRLADPKWREWLAEAIVDAMKKHFAS